MSDFEHPQLGRLHRLAGEGGWLGRTADGEEIWLEGDMDGPCPACSARAVAELAQLDRLRDRIARFLAGAREPYLDGWAKREWEVNSLIFQAIDEQCAFVAQYLLGGDDYTQWLVRVEAGEPVALGRRPW